MSINFLNHKTLFLIVIQVFISTIYAQDDKFKNENLHPDARYGEAIEMNVKANGFNGIWYMNTPSNDEYMYKYSGGMATYTISHQPMAIYSKKANKTFFCYGGTNEINSTLYHAVSYFDHKSGKIANPTIVLDKNTIDPHDNPVLSMDKKGYIWLFSTSHGTTRPSYIYKSEKPYTIEKFNKVEATELFNGIRKPFNNFSYMQIWYDKSKGFFAIYTRYKDWNNRVLGFNTSKDGVTWNEWKVLAHIEEGHYAVSGLHNGRIAVAFNYHPKIGKGEYGLHYRTNFYYVETSDFGKTWQTASKQNLNIPLTTPQNPTLVKDFKSEGLLCYIQDLKFDKKGNPTILLLSSKGYQSGPKNGPRTWQIFSFNKKWENSIITTSLNNYDTGSIYFDTDGVLRVIGPTDKGPQPYNPGGEMVMWEKKSNDSVWVKVKTLTSNSERNHNYFKQPLNVQPDFYGYWADGHGRKASKSVMYCANRKGEVFVLPSYSTEPMFTLEKLSISTNRKLNSYFLNWPKGKSPEEIGNKVSSRFLETPHSLFGNTKPQTPPSSITYPDVCTWLGGLWFAKATKDNQLYDKFEKRFLPLFNEEKHLQPIPNHVDNNVFGSLPLELYLKNGKKEYLDLGLKYADTQWDVPQNAKPEELKWASQGYSWQTRIWIDDMFMITAIQAQAYRATQKTEYINRAAKEMVLYLDTIQLENGLFYHSPEAHYSWGRGNGWMAVGMAEILRILPKSNPHYNRIMSGYLKMMSALLKYQEKDGMWRQIIDDREAWKETSATAMFTYAFVTGVKNGWLDADIYGNASRKAWLSLVNYLNSENELTEVCAGTNILNSRDHYMNRPRITGDLHGQAPLLWCATALIR